MIRRKGEGKGGGGGGGESYVSDRGGGGRREGEACVCRSRQKETGREKRGGFEKEGV